MSPRLLSEPDCRDVPVIVAELKAVADNSLPEMNRGVEEENEKLRAELDAVKGEIELRVDRIQELKECRTDLHFSKLEKVYSFYLDYRILYGSFFQKKKDSAWICSSRPHTCVCSLHRHQSQCTSS